MKFLKILWIFLGLVVLGTILTGLLFSLVNYTNGEIKSSGVTRNYLLHVPDRYQPENPVPLVISLHGFAEWPAHQRDTSHWNTLADEMGFIVVYPSGTGFPLRWHSQSLDSLLDEPMVDVVFIEDLIDTLSREYNIDPDRVYVNGFSNGGGMAYLLACKLADRIAAFGSVAGAHSYPSGDCNPSRAVPVIAIHGTDDQIVPYEGGEVDPVHFQLPAVTEWVEDWASRNECLAGPIEIPVKGDTRAIKYTNCDENADVYLFTILGGGHAWPGGRPNPAFIVGHTSADINATRMIWAFFERYALDE
jgi:polyhydroxybutyrate depolymerase